ncbi:MAG: hypothetical protein LUD15_09580 [Bacteroides sp.]|nr:hypothetical protein [Bacteroides sp.]
MKIKNFILIISAAMFASCGRKGNSKQGEVIYDTIPYTQITIAPEYYFDGEYMYMADTAVLLEEATGTRLPVAMREHSITAETNYRDLQPEAGEYVFARFYGYMADKHADEEGSAQQLVITHVIEIEKNKKADKNRNLTAVYNGEGESLSLLSDHTFGWKKPGNQINGKWYLVSEDQLVLMSGTGNHLLDIDPEAGTLTTVSESPVTLKR